MTPEKGRIEVQDVGSGTGVKVRMHNASLVLILGKKGYVMCGYLNMDAAERLGDAACMVTGVDTFDDVLSARIKAVSAKAKELGISEGMTGREALEMLS